MITYNHEAYIAQAIDSILMQKVNFDYEIVIGEDCSTDKTREIILRYARQNPDKFKLLLHEKNVGAMKNQLMVLEACTGKYIAMLEGDDYWTDPLKLQKQVDFLEGNPEFVGTFHDSIILNENDGSQYLRIGETPIDETPDLVSIIRQKNMPTASLVFRNCFEDKFWPNGTSIISNGDYLLLVLLARNGKFKYFPEPMSVYRVHAGGVWSSQTRLYTVEQDIKFYNYLEKLFDGPAVQDAIRTKLHLAYYKYAIELVKSGSVAKSLPFLKKALQSKLPNKSSQRHMLFNYLIVFASKIKQILFPFFPPISSIRNLLKW